MRVKHALLTSVLLSIGWVTVHSVKSWHLLNGFHDYLLGVLMVIAIGSVSGLVLFPLTWAMIRSGENYQIRRSTKKREQENISG